MSKIYVFEYFGEKYLDNFNIFCRNSQKFRKIRHLETKKLYILFIISDGRSSRNGRIGRC